MFDFCASLKLSLKTTLIWQVDCSVKYLVRLGFLCVFSQMRLKKKKAMLMWLGVLSNILAVWKCIKLIGALVHQKDKDNLKFLAECI